MTEESPDELRPDKGVTRLNRLPLLIVGGVILTTVLVLGYSMIRKNEMRKAHAQAAPAEAAPPPQLEETKQAAAAVIGKAPQAGAIQTPPPENKPPRLQTSQQNGLIEGADRVVNETLEHPTLEKVDPVADERRQAAIRRLKMRETALGASTAIRTFDAFEEKKNPSTAPKPDSTSSALAAANQALANAAARNQPNPIAAAGVLPGESDVNQQADKVSFLERDRSIGYLHATREMPLSKYELKAGAVIPSVLLGGINSDLPGLIKAQVTQNVYDSATGKYLLIPQGAQLIGTYNSRVTIGQERVEVAWTRINFPDGSTLDLGSMPGTDTAGYSGFHDKVNNHYFKIFGSSIALSLLSAGAQLSQPQTGGVNGQPSPGQTVAAAMGAQFAAAGGEITKRNMQIQPTLEIRPAYRFNIMVDKDILLRPYEETQQ